MATASASNGYVTSNYIVTNGSLLNQAWPAWTQQVMTISTTTGGIDYGSAVTVNTGGVWNVWYNVLASNQCVYPVYNQATPEEIARRREAAKADQVRAQKVLLLRDEADKRAESLLLQFLDEEQEKAYRAQKFFEVMSADGSKRYRIKHGWAGNVEVYNPRGEMIEKLCIHPNLNVPHADNLLAQKLLLEADEVQFRRTANITRIAA